MSKEMKGLTFDYIVVDDYSQLLESPRKEPKDLTGAKLHQFYRKLEEFEDVMVFRAKGEYGIDMRDPKLVGYYPILAECFQVGVQDVRGWDEMSYELKIKLI